MLAFSHLQECFAREDDKLTNHETIRDFQERHIIECDSPTGELITSHVIGLYLKYSPIVYLDFGDNFYLRLFQFALTVGILPSLSQSLSFS